MANKAKDLSLRDRIRECNDVEFELVDCSTEWGCTIEMRSPTSTETSELEEWAAAHAQADEENPDPKRFRGMKEKYIVACAFDPNSGKQLFNDADMEWLAEKNGKVIERLWVVAQRLVGLTEVEADALGKSSGKEGPKNSGTT